MKRTVQFALLAVAVLLAVGITLYPLIANAYTERNRSLIETEYTEAISQMDNTALENAMQAARAYNASLRGVTGMTFSKEAVEYASASYEQLLNVHQDGIMAYVEIPKISVNLPIYHGAGDDSLNPDEENLSSLHFTFSDVEYEQITWQRRQVFFLHPAAFYFYLKLSHFA